MSVDLDQKYLKVKRVAARGNGQLVFGDTIKVGTVFSMLIVKYACRTGWVHQYVEAS